jgi:hypothetical protein
MTPVNILEIYKLIRSVEGKVYIDIFNQQYRTPEKKATWQMPAVFIEFVPINWDGENSGCKTASNARIKLHCVEQKISDTSDLDLIEDEEAQNKALEAFNFIGRVHKAVQGKAAGKYGKFDKVNEIPDHNHKGMIVEIIEYKAKLTDDSAFTKGHWVEKTLEDMNISGEFKVTLAEEEEDLPTPEDNEE